MLTPVHASVTSNKEKVIEKDNKLFSPTASLNLQGLKK